MEKIYIICSIETLLNLIHILYVMSMKATFSFKRNNIFQQTIINIFENFKWHMNRQAGEKRKKNTEIDKSIFMHLEQRKTAFLA